MQPEITFKLRLVELAELRFAYNPFVGPEPATLDQLNTEVQTNLSFEEHDGHFVVAMQIRYTYPVPPATGEPTPAAEHEWAIFTARATYELSDIEKVVRPNTQPGWRQLPEPVAAMLVGTTYSTVRGMLFARFVNTPLRQIPLPMIDPLAVLRSTPEFGPAEA